MRPIAQIIYIYKNSDGFSPILGQSANKEQIFTVYLEIKIFIFISNLQLYVNNEIKNIVLWK